MSKQSQPGKTADKMIDRFKDKADDAVDDARQGETDDNPVKETIRDDPHPKEKDTKSRKGNRDG